MGNYTDSRTFAENAGNVELSEAKFAQVRDDILILNDITNHTYLSEYFAHNCVVVVTVRQHAFLLRLVMCTIFSTSIVQFAMSFSINYRV